MFFLQGGGEGDFDPSLSSSVDFFFSSPAGPTQSKNSPMFSFNALTKLGSSWACHPCTWFSKRLSLRRQFLSPGSKSGCHSRYAFLAVANFASSGSLGRRARQHHDEHDGEEPRPVSSVKTMDDHILVRRHGLEHQAHCGNHPIVPRLSVQNAVITDVQPETLDPPVGISTESLRS